MSEVVYDINQIKEIIPHRYPFLLIDRITEFVSGKHIVGIKTVSANEPYFAGHFPDKPVMPGVLILEAVAQVAAILARQSPEVGLRPDGLTYLVGTSGFKWKKQVIPGDTLVIKVELIKKKRPMLVVEGIVTVDGEVVASGTVSAAEGNW